MANTIGTAYIQIKPSTEGIEGSISSALGGESEKAGAEAGGKLSKALGTAAKVGVSAIAGATAAVGAFGKASLDAGMTFDASMSQVAATMGFSTAELADSTSAASQSFQQLRDFAQEMGSTTAFSASEAADALNYMALAGYDAETSMTMLPNVLNLAAAGGIDLASASDMVTDAQTALGLSLEETAVMVDQMARASSKSNTSVEQLGEAFLTVGGTAKNLRGGTEELSQILGVLADNGIKGSEAGTHLRNIMLAMNPTTDAAADAWERLGVDAYDADGNLKPLQYTFEELSEAMKDMSQEEKTRTLSAMFNKTDLSSINALLDTTSDRYWDLKQSIMGAWYTTDSLTESMTNNGFSLDEMKANLEKLGVSAETFADDLDWANGSAVDFADYLWEAADAGVSEEDIINALGGDLDALQVAFDGATGAAQAMADTQLDNLTGDITLFQSALEGAKIAVSDGLTPMFREFVQFGSEGLSTLTEAFKEGGLSGAMEAFGTLLSDLVTMVIEMLPDMIEAASALLKALADGIIDNLPLIIDTGIQIVLELVKGIIDSLPELFKKGVEIINSFVDSVLDNIDKVIEMALDLIVALAEGLIDALPKLIDKAPIIIERLVEAITKNIPKLLACAIQLIIALADGLIQGIPRLILAIPEIILAITSGIANGIVDMIDVGGDLIEGLWEGIKNSWSKLVEHAKSLATNLVDTFKNILRIGSPSKLFRDEVGKWIPAGIAVGIEGNTDVLDDSMKTMQTALDPRQLDVASSYAVNYDTTSGNDSVLALLREYLPQLANMQMVTDTGVMVGALAPKMDRELGRMASMRSRFV